MRHFLLTLILLGIAAPAIAQAPKRPAVPEAAAVAEAKKLIAEVYKKEYDAARSPAQRRELALKLRDDALQTKDEPAARYALLQVAAKVAARTGDVYLGNQIAASMASSFDVNYIELQATVLEETAPHVTLPGDHVLFCRYAQSAQYSLGRLGLWASAQRIAKAAEQSARKIRDLDLARQWTTRSAELITLAEADAALGPAEEMLKKSPADAAANLTAGRVHAFVRGDWTTGLAMLALAEGSPLQPLAEQELRRNLSPSDRVALAKAWTSAAKEFTGAQRKAILRHAMNHYRTADSDLQGFEKQSALKAWEDLFAEAMPDRFYLSELRPVVYEVGHNGLEMFVLANAGGRAHPFSLTLHPPNDGASRAVFALPCPCKYIVGAAGYIDMTDGKPRTASQFVIRVGDREKWRSPKLQEPGALVPFKIDLGTARELEFRVECPGPYNYNRAIFAEPMLQK